MESKSFNTIDIIKFLYLNKKPIIIITTVAAIVSIIVSLIIEPKFKSSVVIFPASTSSVSKALLTDMSRAPKDILKFGEEEETEQLMQVLHSDEIKAKIIAKIEKQEALDNIQDIVREADGLMVARGDLGVETSLEKIPLVQKELILLANKYNKPVIPRTMDSSSRNDYRA